MPLFLRLLGGIIACTAIGAVLLRWQVNGWGSIAWLLCAVLVTVIRQPYAKRTAGNTITETHAASTEKLLLGLVMIGGTFLPLLHLATGVLASANYTLPTWAPLIGVAALVPGLWLFWRSHDDLGRNWSVTTQIREDHSLTSQGVYERVRHPMYTAIWILCAVQPLFVHNGIAGFSGLVAFALLYFVRVPYEEAMMRERFGSAYEAYCARTGRLFPKF
ncbi:MAG: protein-S-isoprenylcysteine O-methyltransferase [Pseudomonadota bacterium]